MAAINEEENNCAGSIIFFFCALNKSVRDGARMCGNRFWVDATRPGVASSSDLFSPFHFLKRRTSSFPAHLKPHSHAAYKRRRDRFVIEGKIYFILARHHGQNKGLEEDDSCHADPLAPSELLPSLSSFYESFWNARQGMAVVVMMMITIRAPLTLGSNSNNNHLNREQEKGALMNATNVQSHAYRGQLDNLCFQI